MITRAFPSMVIDSRGQIAIALLSEETVGVSIDRFDRVLSPDDLRNVIDEGVWIAVYRQLGEGIYMVASEKMNDEPELTTPQENEAAQFAIELALLAWPEWCPHYRTQYKPKMFIPYAAPAQMPVA